MHFRIFTLAIGIMILISCKSKTEQNSDEILDPNTHKVIVEEVIQTKTYTYLRVTEKDTEKWLAVGKRQVKEDDILYYNDSMEMTNFTSKELDRTFETLLFIDKIADKPISILQPDMPKSPFSSKEVTKTEGISISPTKDGITIAEVFSKRDDYIAKRVKVKGQVVKYNAQIMGMNWVHIQDGSNDNDNYDLTITTKDVVKVGDVVTFEGIISLNKDFGAGYAYEVIMEEAKLETKN